MTLTHVLSETPTKELKRAFKSQKEYLYFDISAFNVGMSINIICTNTFKTPNPNTWNGYDFLIENDTTTNFYVKQELISRIQYWLKNNNFEPKTEEQQKEFNQKHKEFKSYFKKQ
jgi:hypothetical protein